MAVKDATAQVLLHRPLTYWQPLCFESINVGTSTLHCPDVTDQESAVSLRLEACTSPRTRMTAGTMRSVHVNRRKP